MCFAKADPEAVAGSLSFSEQGSATRPSFPDRLLPFPLGRRAFPYL